jgi:acyl CoA:acetate/3-ketoacid CoA transferase beta subunit
VSVVLLLHFVLIGTQINSYGNPNTILIPNFSDKKVLAIGLGACCIAFFSAGSFSYTMEHMGPITNSKKNNVNRCENIDKSSPKNKGNDNC